MPLKRASTHKLTSSCPCYMHSVCLADVRSCMYTDALPSFALSIACAACASSALMPFLPMPFPGPSSARGDSALSRCWLRQQRTVSKLRPVDHRCNDDRPRAHHLRLSSSLTGPFPSHITNSLYPSVCKQAWLLGVVDKAGAQNKAGAQKVAKHLVKKTCARDFLGLHFLIPITVHAESNQPQYTQYTFAAQGPQGGL